MGQNVKCAKPGPQEWPTEQRYAERTSVLLTSPTGHLRWRWTSPSFTGPPKQQRKTSLNFTLRLVSMETPLNNNLFKWEHTWEARFKNSAAGPASSPQRPRPLWSWRDRPSEGHARPNRPSGPGWLRCTCRTPGQPQHSERARGCTYSSRRGDLTGKHTTSSWPRLVRASGVFLDTQDKACLQAYSKSHQRFPATSH